ncbi:MAG TPA: two pore domain potassium channel family protein, partial [Caldilineae bacterium]|nr:two pore domain potassium channel family protein [Caldilineae bacterium]
ILWFWLILRREKRRPRDLISEISISRDAQGTLLVVLFVVLIVFQFAVVFILYFEAPALDGNIQTVSDAFWWAFTTVSTVGYGDKYPVTNGGRFVGLSLMFVGIALFSVITGTFAQWFRRRQRTPSSTPSADEKTPALQQAGIAEIKQLLERQEETYMHAIAELNAKIAELESELKEGN